MIPENQAGGPENSWQIDEGESIRVMVVAPALAVRAGLRALLGALQRVEVVGEAAGLEEVRSDLREVDVLVLSAQAATRTELEQALFSTQSGAVLLLVEDQSAVAQALPELPYLSRRAWGVLPLDTSAEELAAAVHALSEGLLVGAPGLVEAIFLKTGGEAQEVEPLVEPLTEREAEVLQWLSRGLANKQIALSLGISEHTVKFHISAIYAKLGATNRTEAVRIGVQRGLVIL